MFSLILAVDSDFGIAKNGVIPWIIKEDLSHFRVTTTDNIIIMGGKTYESIGSKPLSNRINIVISRKLAKTSLTNTSNTQVIFVNSIESCIETCRNLDNISNPTRSLSANNLTNLPNNFLNNLSLAGKKKRFVIGGAEIANEFIDRDLFDELIITHINHIYNCNTVLPKLSEYMKKFKKSLLTHLLYDVNIYKYTYRNVEEEKLLNLMFNIVENGNTRMERTGIGAKSLFAEQLKFDLSNNNFPLITTNKIFLRGIFEELMLMLRGQTDSKILESKGINIWKPNTTREFLDKRGLKDLPVGDMGHSYGFSFRHFGANYINCETSYEGQGFDQLKYILHEIKNNPTSRRIRVSLWEPNKMQYAALPPCLEQYQFYVDGKHLSCIMNQRSSDIAVAGGWNIAAGALLTILLAKVCGLTPSKLTWNVGDVHIYNNLIEQVKDQIIRQPKKFPKLEIVGLPHSDIESNDSGDSNYKNNHDIDAILYSLLNINFDNLKLSYYYPDPHIKFIMNP